MVDMSSKSKKVKGLSHGALQHYFAGDGSFFSCDLNAFHEDSKIDNKVNVSRCGMEN